MYHAIPLVLLLVVVLAAGDDSKLHCVAESEL